MIKVSAIEDESPEDEQHEPMESTSEPEAPKALVKVKRVRKKSEPSNEPVTVPTSQPVKMGRMTTCQNCGKELLEKTFKYYHQLKCKPAEATLQEQHIKAERPESITVDFNFRNRTDVKQAKYANLFTKAF